jgi:acetoin utilization deacetylase AcuC-like enzyme
MAALPLFHAPGYAVRLPDGHGFPMDKYAALPAALGADATLMTPEAAPLDWLEAVHDPVYVAAVAAAQVSAAIERRIGFPVTAAVSARTRLVAGGTYLAARHALAHGWAANGAGGSHHALPDTGAGYCVTNDLAIAAQALVREGRVARILIVDLDVHQGDGTAVIFAGREDILTFSMHGAKNFPVRKARSFRDVSLADGTGDADYLAILERELDALIAHHRPELILYQGGVDVFEGDRLGRLALSLEGIAARDTLVAKRARAAGVPMAATLGGGYGSDVMEIAERHALGLRAQWAVWAREL